LVDAKCTSANNKKLPPFVFVRLRKCFNSVKQSRNSNLKTSKKKVSLKAKLLKINAMKKILLATIILVAVVFTFERSSGKECNGYFNVGGINHTATYFQAISADTLLNQGDAVNLQIFISVVGLGSCGCTIDSAWCVYNGNLLANSLSYTVTDTGIYDIYERVAGYGGCMDPVYNFHLILHVGYRVETSVSAIYHPDIFQIYPNPTTNNFTLKNIPINETSSLQIINTIGEIVYAEKLIGRRELIIHPNLSSGIYFVRVNDRMQKLVVE
jgi:hypothetical protein